MVRSGCEVAPPARGGWRLVPGSAEHVADSATTPATRSRVGIPCIWACPRASGDFARTSRLRGVPATSTAGDSGHQRRGGRVVCAGRATPGSVARSRSARHAVGYGDGGCRVRVPPWITLSNPPGFFRDEVSIALNTTTLSESLRDGDGGLLPLYPTSFGDFSDVLASRPGRRTAKNRCYAAALRTHHRLRR